MRKKGEIDFWDKEAVKQLIAETCPSLVEGTDPVYYCRHCMSLGIWGTEIGDTCGKCGSTDIDKATMEEYDALYEQKFGKKLFNIS